MSPRVVFGAAFALAAAAAGCKDIERFDTDGDAAFCGSIVGASFAREGFDYPGLRLRLEIDADLLTTAPGTITTDDAEDTTYNPCAPRATFEEAKLRVVEQVFHDPLSTLQFGEGREHNFLAWAESTCRGQMLVVTSLLENDDAEVRVLGPYAPEQDGVSRPVFGVFPLARKSQGCGF